MGNTSETVSFTVNKSKVNVGYAIIIAGRNDYDLAGQAINISANNSYNVLLKRGFTHERIFYLNPCMKHDADLDGEYDVDKISSLNNIEYAINTWAQRNVSVDVPLLIYMVGHGGNDTFIVNGTNDNLTASELNNYLDQITDTTGCCYISIVYDASHSGSFIDNLSRCGRVIVTSVDSDADALYLNKKGVIFSEFFFDSISSGKTIKEAFENASNHFETLNFSDKTPRLDDNGDGNGSTISHGDDGLLAASIYFGSQEGSIDFSPTITSAIQNKIYNYKIRTGSYLESIDESDKNNDVLGERIAGREFTDANRYSYNNGIPTIRLDGV